MKLPMKKKSGKKKVLIVLAAAVILMLAYLIFRLFNPSVGFTYYEPAYLPPGISVKAKRISISPYSTMVELNFRTEDWVYSIGESKADGPLPPATQNYDSESVKPTCDRLTSPAGQVYRLCHWIDYGRINVQEVTFIKGGTSVRSQIPTVVHRSIPIAQINKYVDSFKPASTTGFPVLRGVAVETLKI